MKNSNNQFWASFSDLMTSLFFVMLILYILTFILLQQRNKQYKKKVEELNEILHKKNEILETYHLVENSLSPLKNDKLLHYDKRFKRYTLSFDIYFRQNYYRLNSQLDLYSNYRETINKLLSVGKHLKELVDSLNYKKKTNPKFKNVNYLFVITGSASNLPGNNVYNNYVLSYKRALSLYDFWKSHGIDFDSKAYHQIIDLQIAGNGIGGVGRFPDTNFNNYSSEKRNQRFIINIVPKIGEIENLDKNK